MQNNKKNGKKHNDSDQKKQSKNKLPKIFFIIIIIILFIEWNKQGSEIFLKRFLKKSLPRISQIMLSTPEAEGLSFTENKGVSRIADEN
jgi:hypothetical protein